MPTINFPTTTAVAVTPVTIPLSYVPVQGCTCIHTWTMSGTSVMGTQRWPSPTCPLHAPPKAVNEHACPTCGHIEEKA